MVKLFSLGIEKKTYNDDSGRIQRKKLSGLQISLATHMPEENGTISVEF